MPSAFQCRLEWHEAIPSTSALLLERAGAADFHGTVISAHRQTQGRGRRGRTWETGEGNLAFSVGFRVAHADQDKLPYFPLCAGIAVHRAISEFLAPEAARELDLKWPNDLAWRGKKLMGLLSQARTLDGATYLSIGIGINIAWAPLALPAVALTQMPLAANYSADSPPPKEAVLARVLAAIEATHAHWNDFAFVKHEWETRAHYLGKRIFFGLLEKENEMEAAMALGLDKTGALRVKLEASGKEQLLSTEDLSLRLG